MGGKGSGRTRTKPYCIYCEVPLVEDCSGITGGSPGRHFEQWHCPKRDGCGNQTFTYYPLDDCWDWEEEDEDDEMPPDWDG